MTLDEGPFKKKSNAPKVEPQGWKSTLFIIFIIFICQKFSRISLLI